MHGVPHMMTQRIQSEPAQWRLTTRAQLRLVTLVALATLLSGCGPTPTESAQVVLVGLPLMLVGNALLIAVLRLLWRNVRTLPAIDWRRTTGLFGAALATALVTAIVVENPFEWLGLALVFVAPTGVTVALVAWRVQVFGGDGGLFTPLAVMTGFVLAPAAMMLAEVKLLTQIAVFIWVLPGYFGFVAGLVFVLMVVEAVVRRLYARRGKSAPAHAIVLVMGLTVAAAAVLIVMIFFRSDGEEKAVPALEPSPAGETAPVEETD